MAKSQHAARFDWPESQIIEFVGLTTEANALAAATPPPPSSWLLAPFHPSNRPEDSLAEVRRHPIYEALAADDNFAKARRLFSKRAKSKNPGKYSEPFGEVRLFGIVALVVGTHASKPKFRPRLPTKAAKKTALRLATELLGSLDGGIRLDDLSADANLRLSLQHLVRHLTFELSQPVGVQKRKQREDGLYIQRYYLDGLIKLLLSAFDDASPSIVAAVAAMMGFDPDTSTIDRRIAEVKHREAQVEKRRKAVEVDRS